MCTYYYWDATADEYAEVVCRQLGYPTGNVTAFHDAGYFGQGTGLVALEIQRCVGNESSLLDCSYTPYPYVCTHYWDVGVICDSKLITAMLILIQNLI